MTVFVLMRLESTVIVTVFVLMRLESTVIGSVFLLMRLESTVIVTVFVRDMSQLQHVEEDSLASGDPLEPV